MAWIHGRAKIVVYNDNAFTTIKFTITSYPTVMIGSLICPSSSTIFLPNPTSGVSYFGDP